MSLINPTLTLPHTVAWANLIKGHRLNAAFRCIVWHGTAHAYRTRLNGVRMHSTTQRGTTHYIIRAFGCLVCLLCRQQEKKSLRVRWERDTNWNACMARSCACVCQTFKRTNINGFTGFEKPVNAHTHARAQQLLKYVRLHCLCTSVCMEKVPVLSVPLLV